MRTKSLFLLVYLCISLCALHLSIPSFAERGIISARDTLIAIDPLPGPNPGYIPHAPVIIPISAEYESSSSSVLLTFRHDIGEIEVDITNMSNGGFLSEWIDTQNLYAIIPLTSGSGHYIMIFSLSSGQQYQGEFDVY